MAKDVSLAQPLTFEPLFMERVWGGRRLEVSLGKKLPAEKKIGESWEIVDRSEAQSVVRHGPLRGQTLHRLWLDYREEIFGAELPNAPRFPILAKLLDAREKLSVQVHPLAELAASLGGEAKTEMWYFLAAEPGAEIFSGLRRGISRAEFEQAVAAGDVERCLHRVATKAGDAFFIPSGRLHAIGAGNLIVEIQQNSDTTYRVFDWNRLENGKPRTLHTAAAMRSIDFADDEPDLLRPNDEFLLRAPEFTVEKWELRTPRRASTKLAFAIFVCVRGALQAGGSHFQPGDFFLAPASASKMELRPTAPYTTVLRVTLPR